MFDDPGDKKQQVGCELAEVRQHGRLCLRPGRWFAPPPHSTVSLRQGEKLRGVQGMLEEDVFTTVAMQGQGSPGGLA